MKAYSSFEPKKAATREPIPAGGYVVKILSAKEQINDWGNVILVSFDVIEGPLSGFFKKDYENQTIEDKKWRGVYRLREPKDDGSERDGWTKRSFENAIWSIEASNPGYHWNWDEATLKDKVVGALFRNKEWEMNGNTGWTTECCTLTDAEDIRTGHFKKPKDKPLPAKDAQAVPGFAPVLNDDSDLPWV